MCARGAGTHGDVWSGHTGFSACHTPHRIHTTTTRPQHFTKTETDRERDRERRRRQKEKRREKIHFQCGGAWLFFVDLNTVNYDSSFISFSASWPVNSFFIICELNFLCSYSFHFFIFLINCSYSFKIFRIIQLCSYIFFLLELILHKYSVEG